MLTLSDSSPHRLSYRGNYWNKKRAEPTVYAREKQQLLQAGYRWQSITSCPLCDHGVTDYRTGGGQPVDAFARLRDKRFNGYLAYRVPHELDSIVDAAVSAYRSGSEDARRQLTRDLNADVAAVLSVYGERMAVLAVRTRSVEPLRRGLVGMGLAEGVLDDYRDNLMVLAAVNHSADTVGLGLTKLIDHVEADLPERALARFRDFAQWRDDEKSLRAMGRRVKGEGDSFRYVSG